MRDILNAGFKVGLATLAGLIGWVVAGKVLAITLGAAGVGLFGLLRQLLQNLTLLGSFNGQTALVQGISSCHTRAEQIRVAGSILKIQLLICVVMMVGVFLAAPWLAPWLIPHPHAVTLLRWLCLAMFLMVSQTYILGILNAHRLINELVKSQLVGPLAVLGLVFPMIWLVHLGYPTAFVLMFVWPSFAVTLFAAKAARREGWLPNLQSWGIPHADAANFFRMSTVLLLTGLLTTGTQFLTSWMVAGRMGLTAAGQFWTAWTLSMAYVTLVLGSLGTYYMPSLSRLTDPEAQNMLIRAYLRLALGALPILVSIIIVFKPWVVRGMFSQDLLPALKVMRWMLIGDLFKGVSWVLAFPMLAFNEMKWFFWSEVGFSIAMALLTSIWLLCGGGIEGVGFIFMIIYIIYLIFVIYYIRVQHKFYWTKVEGIIFICATIIITTLSGLTWQDQQVYWKPILYLVTLLCLYCFLLEKMFQIKKYILFVSGVE